MTTIGLFREVWDGLSLKSALFILTIRFLTLLPKSLKKNSALEFRNQLEARRKVGKMYGLITATSTAATSTATGTSGNDWVIAIMIVAIIIFGSQGR